jgi:hypothetical protein
VPTWEFNLGNVIQFGRTKLSVIARRDGAPFPQPELTHVARGFNNSCMARPDAAHRVKSYSAATGYVYQYYFYEVNKAKRGAVAGTEYVYMASVDRKHVFPVKIFVAKEALEKWSAQTGREFTGTEEYAVAKMRLFQAFDDVENLAEKNPDLTVDGSNLEELSSQLDL